MRLPLPAFRCFRSLSLVLSPSPVFLHASPPPPLPRPVAPLPFCPHPHLLFTLPPAFPSTAFHQPFPRPGLPDLSTSTGAGHPRTPLCLAITPCSHPQVRKMHVKDALINMSIRREKKSANIVKEAIRSAYFNAINNHNMDASKLTVGEDFSPASSLHPLLKWRISSLCAPVCGHPSNGRQSSPQLFQLHPPPVIVAWLRPLLHERREVLNVPRGDASGCLLSSVCWGSIAVLQPSALLARAATSG